jgi:L-malate glycosyltransferase
MKIHQLLPCIRPGDAISNHTLEIQRIVRSWGYDSKIFADDIHDHLRSAVKSYTKLHGRDLQDALLIYHFSVGSDVSDLVRSLPNKKILIYHNITPASFLKGYDDYIKDILEQGRDELKHFVNLCDLALGDSEYNRLELEEMGFPHTGVLPIIVNFDKYTTAPTPKILTRYRDGAKNILFVGRIVPNKCQEDLILAFYWYKTYINPQARLFLIGMRGIERYDFMLSELVRRLHLEDVYFLGLVPDSDLAAYYQVADLLLCMSEHEGFNVPMLEAMHVGIPVLAYNSTSIPYTLAGAGVLVNEKRFDEIAEMMHLLMDDQNLRQKIVAGQHKRLEFFQRSHLEGVLKNFIAQVVSP